MASRCTGVVLHPEIVVYAAHCGLNFSTVRTDSEELGVRYCRALPDASLTGGNDLAFCRLEHPINVDIVPPATGCEEAAVQPGASIVMVGYGQDYRDGQFGIRRESPGAITSVTDTEVVVDVPESGICAGDSGGPLIVSVPEPSGSSSLRVAAIASASPEGECRASASHYVRLAPHLAWLERESGLDLTPCGDAEGSWEPTPRCNAPVDGMETSCGERPSPGLSASCGAPFSPDPPDEVLPRVSVRSPVRDAVLPLRGSSALVDVSLEASDVGWGLAQVGFRILDASSTVVASNSRSFAPYVFHDVSLPGPGHYVLKADATDEAGLRFELAQPFQVRAEQSGCHLAVSGRRAPFGLLASIALGYGALLTRRRRRGDA